MDTNNKWNQIENVLDNMGLKYSFGENAYIEFWTDKSGQNIPTEFNYDGTPEDFVAQFVEAAERYDVDTEVELYVGMRGRNGVPNTIRELLDDCQEAKDTLIKIANRLQKAIEEV